jgi:REP element-mobilizing transposase RayT
VTLPRQVIPGSFYLITRRCTQRQFLLRPDEVTNDTLTYCLGEAAQRFNVDLLMGTGMSNHHHTAIFDRYGQVNEFTEHFHKFAAKAINAHRGRTENLWSSDPPSVVRLLDPEAVIDAIVYIATNPVKDGLVERVRHWPGVSGLASLLEERALRVRRPDHFFRPDGPMPDEVTLEFVIPPELGDPDAIRHVIRERVAAEEEQFAKVRRENGRRVLGRSAVLNQSWRETPSSAEARRTLRPRFAATFRERLIETLAAARIFVDAYRKARVRWLVGLEAEFPPGTYWLHRFAGVRVAALQS